MIAKDARRLWIAVSRLSKMMPRARLARFDSADAAQRSPTIPTRPAVNRPSTIVCAWFWIS